MLEEDSVRAEATFASLTSRDAERRICSCIGCRGPTERPIQSCGLAAEDSICTGDVARSVLVTVFLYIREACVIETAQDTNRVNDR